LRAEKAVSQRVLFLHHCEERNVAIHLLVGGGIQSIRFAVCAFLPPSSENTKVQAAKSQQGCAKVVWIAMGLKLLAMTTRWAGGCNDGDRGSAFLHCLPLPQQARLCRASRPCHRQIGAVMQLRFAHVPHSRCPLARRAYAGVARRTGRYTRARSAGTI
jgi:hypothetical protein